MSKFDEPDFYNQKELLQINWDPPKTGWMDTPTDLRQGTYIYPAKAKNLNVMGFPHARDWAVEDIDWNLPEDWQRIVLEGMADRLAELEREGIEL